MTAPTLEERVQAAVAVINALVASWPTQETSWVPVEAPAKVLRETAQGLRAGDSGTTVGETLQYAQEGYAKGYPEDVWWVDGLAACFEPSDSTHAVAWAYEIALANLTPRGRN